MCRIHRVKPSWLLLSPLGDASIYAYNLQGRRVPGQAAKLNLTGHKVYKMGIVLLEYAVK
jgi:hypothetical protein